MKHEEQPAAFRRLADRWPFWRCVRYGVGIGAVYAGLALAATSSVEFEEHYGIPLLRVLLGDVIGGALGGALVGLLLPGVRNLGGFILTGIAAVLPATFVVNYDADAQGHIVWVTPLLTAVLIGSMLGVSVWARERRNDH